MADAFSLPIVFSAIGAVAGLLLQQAIDVWKTKTNHRQQLQRRFFDLKLQTAVDVAKSLDALVAAHQGRLVEAFERTREDDNFFFLDVSRGVMDIHSKALERDYDRYVAAFAVLELVFSPAVVSIATEDGVAVELTTAWRRFDEGWHNLQGVLEKLLPESRMQELRQQKARGHFESGADTEMERWFVAYKSENAMVRGHLPRLVELTQRAEQHRRKVLQAMRDEMRPFLV